MTPHPDDEQLSAHLDGEATADVAAHVEACGGCQERLADLRSAAEAVAQPVGPPHGAARDEAVTAALHAWGEEPGVGAPGGPNILPLRRRRRVSPRLVAAAAAVVGVLAAGAVVATSGRDGGDDQTALAPPRAETFGEAGSAPVVNGGDLGEQSDARLLGETVRAGLGGSTPAAPAPPPAASQAGERPAADAARATTAEPPCTEDARQLLPGLGTLVYTASLRWQGTPAVVLAFQASPSAPRGRLAHQVMVMAPQEACRLLVVQRL